MPMPYIAALHTPSKVSQEQLTTAWHGLRDRGYACVAGATSLDEVLGRTTGGALVRMHARCIANGLQRFRDEVGPVHQRPDVIAPEAPFPITTTPPHRAGSTHRRADQVDRKRAAAGDRDDD